MHTTETNGNEFHPDALVVIPPLGGEHWENAEDSYVLFPTSLYSYCKSAMGWHWKVSGIETEIQQEFARIAKDYADADIPLEHGEPDYLPIP